MNHAQLVEAAAMWLRLKCAVVVTELSTTGEIPDAIGWRDAQSTLIECKVSRTDFMADRHKWFRREHRLGIGSKRYFLTAPGVVRLDDLPEKWGLLELASDRVRVMRESESFQNTNHTQEIRILLSALRRIGHTAPAGVSIRCYTIKTKNCATLSTELLEPA